MPSFHRKCYMAVDMEGNVLIKIKHTVYGVKGFAWRKVFKGKRCVVVYRDLENGTRVIALLSLKGKVIVSLDMDNFGVHEEKKCNAEAKQFLKLAAARKGNDIFEGKIQRFYDNELTQQTTDEFKLIDPNETEDEDIRGCVVH